jgi:hypothetical protein
MKITENQKEKEIANSCKNKTINEVDSFRNIEKNSFEKFCKHHKGFENVMFIFYNLIYVVPLFFNIYTLSHMQLYDFIITFMVTWATEGFLFVSTHLYLHETILIGYQHKTIIQPWAYYHHYVNPLINSQIPFGYRLSGNQNFLFIDVCCYLFNVDKYVYALLNIILLTDYLTHEYVHSTRKSHYISFNPLSPKFILIRYVMKGLQNLRLIDPGTHSKEHHKEKSENMHLTKDWLDLKFPILCQLQEMVGITEFKYFKKILKAVNGTDEAVFIENKMNIKANVEIFVVTIWNAIKSFLILYLLSFVQLNNRNPINKNLIIYTVVLRVIHFCIRYNVHGEKII